MPILAAGLERLIEKPPQLPDRLSFVSSLWHRTSVDAVSSRGNLPGIFVTKYFIRKYFGDVRVAKIFRNDLAATGQKQELPGALQNRSRSFAF